MKITLRIERDRLDHIRRDLQRPHRFAFERVGFLFCRFGWSKSKDLIVLAHSYMPVLDDHYVEDSHYGALIGEAAFRCALQRTIVEEVGIFHIHLHSHKGVPRPSHIDVREAAKFVPDFFHVRGFLPHGALIASRDSISGRVWLGEREQPVPITTVRVVGAPIQFLENVA